jgi:hypothetical protein
MKFKNQIKVFIVLFFLIPNIRLFTQEIPVRDLNAELFVPVGDRENEFGSAPENAVSSTLPDRPLIGSGFPVGFIIYDGVNDRIVLTDNKLTFQHTIATNINILLWPTIANDEQTIILQSRSQGIILFTQSREIRLSVYQFPEFRDYRSFAYYDDVLFVHDAELNLWSIPEPVMDQAENRAKLLNERQTREYVNERWGSTGELQVDEEGRLFIDGQLVTRDWSTYLEYYAERNENQQAPSYAAERPYRGYLDRFRNNLRYLGKDAYGNRYWNSAQRTVFVFSEDGWVKKIFHYDPLQISGYPAVEYQTGDIYFLGRPVDNNTSIPLYRIPNDWSHIDASLQSESGTSREVSQNPRATVINSRLRVRSAPSQEGEMLGMLEIGEEVRVLEKSDQELNIGELTDFWYRIDNGNGLTGWAYGAFLRMDGE